MSALNSLTATPFKAPAPAGTTSAVSKLVTTPTEAPTGNSSLSALTAKPFSAPAAKGPAPEDKYYEGYQPSGSFLGIADSKDPFSGRPYFAYRTPGAESTTTDMTRTAPKQNPAVAAKQPKDAFENPRMPETASSAVRAEKGATSNDQLDHRMALAVGGSNNGSNLKVVPTKVNQAASALEGDLAKKVANGELSLFEAQKQEAASKGLDKPWTDERGNTMADHVQGIFDTLKNVEDKVGITALTNWFTGLANPTYESMQSSGEALAKTVSDIKQNPKNASVWTGDALSTVANGLSAFVNAGSVGFSALSQGADKVPVLSQANGALNWLIGKGGEAGGNVAVGAIQKLPIAQEWKDNLSAPLDQVGTLAGQLLTGGLIFHELGTAVKAKGSPTGIASLHAADFQKIVTKAQTFSKAVTERLPTKQQMQQGFIKLPFTSSSFKDTVADNVGKELNDWEQPAPPKEGQVDIESLNRIDELKQANATRGLTQNEITEAVGLLRKQGIETIPSVAERRAASGQGGYIKIPGLGGGEKKVETPQEAAPAASRTDEGKSLGSTELESIKSAPVKDAVRSSLTKAEEDRSKIDTESLPATLSNLKMSPDSLKNVVPDDLSAIHSLYTAVDKNATEFAHHLSRMDLVKPQFDIKTLKSLIGKIDRKRATGRAYGAKDIGDFIRAQGVVRSPAHAREIVDNVRHMLHGEPVDMLDTPNEWGYRGMNLNIKLSDGTKTELQLHTPETLAAKEAIHPIYEKYRDTPIEKIPPEVLEQSKKAAEAAMKGVKAEHEQTALAGMGSLSELADQQKSAEDFQLSLTPDELDRVKFLTKLEDDKAAATAFYDRVKAYYARRGRPKPDEAAPANKQPTQPKAAASGTKESDRLHISQQAQKSQEILRSRSGEILEGRRGESEVLYRSTPLDKSITEHNGGVEPPTNRSGYLEPPEIDWTTAKDKAAVRLSTDTMERNLEKIFPRKVADEVNAYLVEPVRANETKRVQWVTKLREGIKKDVVDNLGIKPRSTESALMQQFGEGRLSLDELKEKSPAKWEQIVKATDYFRSKYDGLLTEWNKARAEAGLRPIPRRQNYFRHFLDLNTFASRFGWDFSQQELPTAISGITEYFKSQTPWASAAMRRLGHVSTDDAIKGMDDYLDNTSRAIFHTDSVQRGRLLEKYLREAAQANPFDIKLPNFASNLNDWTNLVSGKQARLDRAIESVLGRKSLAFMRQLTRKFGANVIAGNISASITHAIPFVFTLATVDKGAAFTGLTDVVRAPFLADFNKVDGQNSAFLTRRYGSKVISPTIGEKAGEILSKPFHWVDQFISRFAVSAKYFEKISDGLKPAEAMKEADNYAARVIGDRSTGNLPNLMNTKTLGWLTQFQIEVNDNLHVLLHDVPRWEHGNVIKIANTFVQFAVYSYLFNQAMQYIKGSGKGLDPIDLGLTLAGLNEEGRDKNVMERLQTFGTDLAKELPFMSVPTGGQIPALQPLTDAVQQAAAGSPIKALTGVIASFGSPIGGGIQAQKTYNGVDAWRNGFVTDAQGHVTATVPQDIPTLLQGVLFGKNAFSSVKASKIELSHLSQLLKNQQATGKLKDEQAANIWAQLKDMSPDEAKVQLTQIASEDADMAKRVIAAAKDSAMGITKQDVMLRSLGIASGARAAYVVDKMKAMKTDDEKKAYLLDLAQKKILTDQVLQQVVQLMK